MIKISFDTEKISWDRCEYKIKASKLQFNEEMKRNGNDPQLALERFAHEEVNSYSVGDIETTGKIINLNINDI